LPPPGRKYKCDNIKRTTMMMKIQATTVTMMISTTMTVAAIVSQGSVVDEDDPAQCL
jgi:hypothetical protein